MPAASQELQFEEVAKRLALFRHSFGQYHVIGDCLKLLEYSGPERKAVVVVGYEHTPVQIPLEPLFKVI